MVAVILFNCFYILVLRYRGAAGAASGVVNPAGV
jgi:hypothetical protein